MNAIALNVTRGTLAQRSALSVENLIIVSWHKQI